MFLVNIEYTVPISIIEEHTANHRAWLDIQVAQDLILCAGPKVPRTGGVIIAMGNEQEKVEELFKHDPFCTNQLAKYTFTKFVAGRFNPLIKDLVS